MSASCDRAASAGSRSSANVPKIDWPPEIARCEQPIDPQDASGRPYEGLQLVTAHRSSRPPSRIADRWRPLSHR